MADQAQRGPRRHEPSSRLDSPLGRAAAASAGGPGSGLTAAPPGSPIEAGRPGTGIPTLTPQATFWHLQRKGLTPGEAANLTAFMCGLPTSDLRWSLVQINHLLFLQRLYQLGRFGIGEGERIRPH